LKESAPQTVARHPAEEKLSLFGYYLKCFKNYAKFSGRARRREYWVFYFFSALVVLLFALLAPIAVATGSSLIVFALSGSVTIYFVFTFIPGFAVFTRRLHDTDRSLLSMLWVLLPVVGMIYIFIVLCTDSAGDNHYGPSPKHTLF
jgi:uncharacterized membrane protein YhaH (DUF805 family)